MAQFRKSENPDQGFPLPPSPRDWLPQGHLAWFIQDVVAAAVMQCANDNGQLLPVLNQAFENTTLIPKRLLADAGYKNESDIAELKAKRIPLYQDSCRRFWQLLALMEE